jgi:polyisoprenoid-binding protein YceI
VRAAPLVLGVLCAAVAFAGRSAAVGQDGARAIDPAHSHAAFTVSHLYVTSVSGTLPVSGGTVMLAPGSSVPARIEATLDATKLQTGDPDRDDSLQGPDWFDTKRFPQWTFVSTSITAGAERTFKAAGTLTIHGVAQPVVLDGTVTGPAEHPVYHGSAHVDRHLFGMRVTPMDGTIGSDVAITIGASLR